MLTNENYKEILNEETIAVVLITGNGCANCVTMDSIVKNGVQKFHEVNLHIVEANDSNFEINETYAVSVVPTVLILHKGNLISRIQGYQPQEIFDLYLEAKIEEITGGKGNV